MKWCNWEIRQVIWGTYLEIGVLGRPWREFAKTVLLRCEIGDHIHHEGFHDWDKKEAHDTIFYAEYQNYGPGADVTARAPFVKQLSDSEASEYKLKNVLGDWALN